MATAAVRGTIHTQSLKYKLLSTFLATLVDKPVTEGNAM